MNGSQLTVLAVGASGSIGRYVVASALNHGYGVRALVRDLGRVSFPSGVEIVVGDLTRGETLSQAAAGTDAIVFTHGTYGDRAAAERVDYGGVRNVLVSLGSHCVRIALMTAIGVTDRKGAHDWKRRAERPVRASGLPYTIVRPGWFDANDPDQKQLVLLQGDRRQSGTPDDGVVARRQIAEVLVRSLAPREALNKTFELVAEIGPEQADFNGLFVGVDPDADNALDGIHDARNMPLEQEPPQVLADIERIERVNRVNSRREVSEPDSKPSVRSREP